MWRWTRPGVLPILLTLFLLGLGYLRGDEGQNESAVALRETRLALKAAEERFLEVSAEVVRTRKELEQTRANFLEAQAEVKQVRAELAALRLQAANVLVNPEAAGGTAALAQALRDFRELNQLQKDVYRQLVDYQRAVDGAMALLQGSAALRQDLANRMALIQRKVSDADRLSGGPANGPAELQRDECQVLASQEELAVAVLDLGRDQGAKPGMQWLVTTPDGETVKLQMVEVRQTLSAAAVLEGRLAALRPGLTARRATPTRKPEGPAN